MTSAWLIAALVRMTKALAIAAPVVIFGFLYVLAVQPERAAAASALQQLDVARAHLARDQSLSETAAAAKALALSQFDSRTGENDRAPEVAAAIAEILKGPAFDIVSNISVETGAPADGRPDPRTSLFSRPLPFTPVTVSFDARLEHVARLFANLRGFPTTFELRSVELANRGGASVHVKTVLFVFRRQVRVHLPKSGRP
jgi:hypothetical protein